MSQQNIDEYDEKKNVCNNQANYNVALRKAIDYNDRKNMIQAIPFIKLYIILWAITFTWAILLALKVSEPEHRVIHVTLAAIFSPAYLIGHYLVQLGLPQSVKSSQEGSLI
jgi:hypothetical protein